MTPQLKRINALAKKVRKAVVDTGIYNRDTLIGGCGTASYHLMRCAKKSGITVRFVHGRYIQKSGCSNFHAWVEYQGHVIDLTKRQFDNDEGILSKMMSPKIAVIPFEKAKKNYDLERPGIRTRYIAEAWDWIESWAIYPDSLDDNLIVVP